MHHIDLIDLCRDEIKSIESIQRTYTTQAKRIPLPSHSDTVPIDTMEYIHTREASREGLVIHDIQKRNVPRREHGREVCPGTTQ